MKLDFCTMMVHKREWELLPLQINSIKHHMSSDFNSFKISVPDDDHEIIEYCSQFNIEVLPSPRYVQADKAGGMKQAGYDTANRMDQLMRACTTDWVVLAHLDVVYIGDLVGTARSLLNDEFGVIGFWPHGVTIINRRAYKDMHYGFWPITCFEVEILNEYHARLCGPDTPRGDGKIRGVLGIDTGEFITIEMPVYGHKFMVMPFGVNWINYYRHIGGQSYIFTNSPEEDKSGVPMGIEEGRKKALEDFKLWR